MKIGLFIDTFYPMVDGVVKVVDNYARELSKTDEVIVFCPRTDKKKMPDVPYKIVQCPCIPMPGTDYGAPMPFFSRSFKRELDRSGLDIVHIHSPFTVGKEGVKYARKHKIPVIATIHSQYDRDLKKGVGMGIRYKISLAFLMKTFNSVDKCYAVNQKTGEHFIEELGLKTPCAVLRNASELQPVESKKAAYKLVNETFSLKENEKVYLYVGRIDFIKNLEFLVESLSILKQNGRPFKMLFVGDGHDGQALADLVEAKGLTDDVVFCGRINDKDLLSAIYARARLLLFPSLYDANSLVQLEASGQNTPAVFIKGSITSSTTIDNVNAFWSEDDPTAFAQKIMEIEDDKELYSSVAKGAKRDLYLTWSKAVAFARKTYLKHIEEYKEKGISKK